MNKVGNELKDVNEVFKDKIKIKSKSFISVETLGVTLIGVDSSFDRISKRRI